jgi:hypothetical protein
MTDIYIYMVESSFDFGIRYNDLEHTL